MFNKIFSSVQKISFNKNCGSSIRSRFSILMLLILAVLFLFFSFFPLWFDEFFSLCFFSFVLRKFALPSSLKLLAALLKLAPNFSSEDSNLERAVNFREYRTSEKFQKNAKRQIAAQKPVKTSGDKRTCERTQARLARTIGLTGAS